MALFICELSELNQDKIWGRYLRQCRKNGLFADPEIMNEKIVNIYGKETTDESIKMDDIVRIENGEYIEIIHHWEVIITAPNGDTMKNEADSTRYSLYDLILDTIALFQETKYPEIDTNDFTFSYREM